MDYLINPLLEISAYGEILHSLKEYTRPLHITGPSDSQKAHMAYAICRHLGLKGMIVSFNEMQARKTYEDLTFFLGEDVAFFPSREIMMHDVEAKSYDSAFQRLTVLDRMIRGQYSFVVTSAEAAAHMLVSKEYFTACTITFRLGGRIDLGGLSQRFVEMGYERVDTVEGPGQFAVRGGIIDVFSINNDTAVRIELFDDEVDSIRTFDTLSQRSVEKRDSVRVIPAREAVYSGERLPSIVQKIEGDLVRQVKKIAKKVDAGYVSHLEEKIRADVEKLKSDHYFPGIDRYTPYLLDKPHSITDYIHGGTLVFIDEPRRFKQRLENVILEHYEVCKGLLEKGRILPESRNMLLDYDQLKAGFENGKTVYMSTLASDEESLHERKGLSIPSRLMGSYQGLVELLMDDVYQWKSRRSRVIILSGTRGKGERLAETLRSKGTMAVYSDAHPREMEPGEVFITRGSLHKGFEYPSIGLVIVSEREVFGQDRKHRKPPAKKKEDRLSLFTDLGIGDYVVHQAHGIGQYVGIEKLTVDGISRDYLKIRYMEGDFLYIPTNQMDLIQKYIGSEGKAPKLSKLGGSDWTKAKKKVKESLREIAGELVKLYAMRQSMKGFAFSKDVVWQRQFEELFPYEETEDQIKCIDEVKRDMEAEGPMDRLLCGDVGYGKTEVAIRAIFKAVMDGKQVAYIVPTTILAQQQYNNFKERMRDFPVTVEMISRFRSPAEQRRILKDLKAGNVDVLIGTHRLLQKDIHFKDLGLLVVDEEQRFGVAHKERIKDMKPNIDVLTLTATPIPRTLHMSLVGIRDISVIEDPPEERYPVQTYVMEHDAEVIRDAIYRELARKGQVFYLFNRVRSIDLKASEIQAMVPEARVAVAHGQMDEGRLEDLMVSFLKGKFDILVCTTIIESGLDMPNVNTMIVEDADRLGLSQLYQIKGRVGRSNRLAYAYITYRRDKILSEVAEKRLQAIKEFTELGSGFKIAMRDLEIRGAGNLLGAEQHGHMESVGYDMYCKLLEEAVRELKGEPAAQANFETTIDLNVSAYIDSGYIGVESRKIEMYKRIASIQEEQDIADIEDELVDRFGDPPAEVGNLIAIAYIKALARNLGFSAITEKNGHVIFQLAEGRQPNIEVIGKMAAKYKRGLLFNAGTNPYIMYRVTGLAREKLLDNIKIVLQDFKNFEEN